MSNLVFLLAFIVVSVLLAMYINHQSKKNLLDVIKTHPVHLEPYTIPNALGPKLDNVTLRIDLLSQEIAGVTRLIHGQIDNVFNVLTILSHNIDGIEDSVRTTQKAIIEHLTAMPKLDVSMFINDEPITFLRKEDLISGVFVTHIAQGHGMITKVNKKTFIVEFEDTIETFNIDDLPNVTFILGLYLFSPVQTKEISLSDTWFTTNMEKAVDILKLTSDVQKLEFLSDDDVKGVAVID